MAWERSIKGHHCHYYNGTYYTTSAKERVGTFWRAKSTQRWVTICFHWSHVQTKIDVIRYKSHNRSEEGDGPINSFCRRIQYKILDSMPPVSVDPPCFWDLFSPLGSHKESMKDLRETCIALLKNDSLRQRSCGFAFFTACLSIWSSWGYLAIKKF